MRYIGYARVSTEEQNLDLQCRALQQAGCHQIFKDCGFSGISQQRPGLATALAALRSGDTLVVWRLDRLGRSLPHLITLIETIGRRNAAFRSLCEHIDTGSAGGRLVFHMMGALAEFERSLISERTRAGLMAARARGQQLGRPRKLTSQQIEYARTAMADGTHPLGVLAARFDVTASTLRRALKNIEGGRA